MADSSGAYSLPFSSGKLEYEPALEQGLWLEDGKRCAVVSTSPVTETRLFLRKSNGTEKGVKGLQGYILQLGFELGGHGWSVLQETFFVSRFLSWLAKGMSRSQAVGHDGHLAKLSESSVQP